MSMNGCLTALPALRKAAESMMLDQVRITRLSGSVTTNPETGIDEVAEELIYEGKCKVQSYGGVAQQSQASATGDTSNIGGVVPLWNLRLDIPIACTSARSGDLATIIEARDQQLIGARLRLVNLQSEKSHATARRWNVQQIPEGDSS